MSKNFDDNVSDTHYLINDFSPLPKPTPKIAEKSILDLFSLKGKVCVVTGSAHGIGLAVAEAYAQAGGDIALWDLNAPKEQAEKIANDNGIKARAYGGDVSDPDIVNEIVDQIEKDFGTIDVFVANAGVNILSGSIVNEANEDGKLWQKVMDINLNGVFYCSRAVGKIFKKNGKGSLIFTGSMSAHIVNLPVYHSAYNTSKAAVVHLAKCLALEFNGFARVNSVSPGYIDSGINDYLPKPTRQRWWSIIPMGREGSLKEVCGAYLYFASDASTYTTGSELVVDGAYTIV